MVLSIAAAAAAAAPATASAAPDAVACAVQGSATFGAPLQFLATAQNVSYGLQAQLSNCTGASAAPAAGTITAGRPLSIAGVAYEAPPAPVGSASCLFAGLSTGTAIVTWADNSVTVLSFNAKAGGLVYTLEGSVVESILLTRVQRDAQGKPVRDLIKTSPRFATHKPAGVVALTPTDPAGCNAPGTIAFGLTGTLVFAVTG